VYIQRIDNRLTMMTIWMDDGLFGFTATLKLLDMVDFLRINFEITIEPVYTFVGLEIFRRMP
jgi:hypothetical protein